MNHDDQEYLLHEEWKKLPVAKRQNMKQCYIWFYQLSQQPQYNFLDWQDVEPWVKQWQQADPEMAEDK